MIMLINCFYNGRHSQHVHQNYLNKVQDISHHIDFLESPSPTLKPDFYNNSINVQVDDEIKEIS